MILKNDIVKKTLNILKNKNVIIALSSAGFFSIAGLFAFNRLLTFSRNKQKLTRILGRVFSNLLKLNYKKLIGQIFDMLINIKFIQQISIENKNRVLFVKQKNTNARSFSFYSERLHAGSKELGVLNINFIEK